MIEPSKFSASSLKMFPWPGDFFVLTSMNCRFIILCMVRMGTDPNLIEFISHRFHQLDEDGGGTLSILEITGGKYDFVNGQIKAVKHNRSEKGSESDGVV